eukprot:TRINITY_DN52785_c0_g1_i1.p2 TRINITY_DN52785_c0_g1~~TRINITY_DN52785_c0_g1_i1.p2  ORF type:complete len:104 (-),score=3.89 TRINITY_DN52785_c0_g1_i1:945-1256(-)
MVLLHIVHLKFNEGVTDEQIADHFKNDARLKERMPDLVEDWKARPNVTLQTRAECNQGMQWVVLVWVKDQKALADYLVHPEHVEVTKIQAPMLHSKIVSDVEL